MFSMDVFCSHHKGLSKFGSLKESFVFSRGRFQKLQTLTATSALLTGLSFVNRHQKIKRFKTKGDKNKAKQTKKCIEFNANRFSFPNTVKLNHLFFCQPCIHCWTASQFHWSPLWQASPTLVLSYCPCPRMRCCVSSPPFSTEVKRKQVSLWRFFRGFPRNMVAERKWN